MVEYSTKVIINTSFREKINVFCILFKIGNIFFGGVYMYY